MIMKTSKFLTSVLSAFMMMGLGMSVASCSDSDNNENGADNLVSTLTLDEKVARFGVETEMESAVVPLNVACKGAWSVAVEKGKDWVSIENNQVFYQGSQTLQLLFDENRTEVDRTAILYITNIHVVIQDVIKTIQDRIAVEALTTRVRNNTDRVTNRSCLGVNIMNAGINLVAFALRIIVEP